MKERRWKRTICLLLCCVIMTSFSPAKGADDSDKNVTGTVRFRYDWLGVNKDKGRFREDNWMTDGSTGGLDWLHIESKEPDRNGYTWLLEGRALYDYDYDFSLLMKKEDSHYFKIDFSSLRRYNDGSNEYFNESLYGLPVGSGGYGSIGGTSEHSDYDIFVDRRNYNIELGLTPPEGPQWTFGWHRLEKDGKELLARGAQVKNAGVSNFRGVPAIAHMQGITDTIYGEVAQTFADKYNFRIRQEFEQYHDHQLIEYPRFNLGALDQYRTLHDDPGYTNWRTMFMFDSFLDEKTYVTANYMYDYLNNDTTRNMIRPDQAGGSNYVFTNNVVGSSRRTNVGAFGYRKVDFLNIPKLYFSTGARVEDSRTSSNTSGLSKLTDMRLGTTSRDEVRIGETMVLTYKGWDKTTLSFDADLEQRHLNWSEYEDIRSMEIHDEGSPDFFNYKANIDYIDQIYKLKLAHRYSKSVKSTVQLQYKDLTRKWDSRFDNAPTFYPGYLGSYHRTGTDLTVKTDIRLNAKTSSALMYQYVQEGIRTARGGKTQNLEIHRGAGSLSFSPTQNMFLVGTFMLENYRLNTPGNGTAASNNGAGTNPYDFSGNSYTLLLDGTYAFNEKTSATLGFQHTEAMGAVDYAGDYVFDKIGLSLKHQFAANQTIGMGYQFYNFENRDHGSWDDYTAHGAFVTYEYTF